MLGMFGFFYGVVAYPIACGSYDPSTQFTEAVVSAMVGASGATAAMSLNMYNGWSYVRDRLLSATVEYEETGWYDGQVYVKDPEMLARDRLLGTYTVRPIVEMLRKTLIGCGAVAMLSLAALRVVDAPTGGAMSGDFGSNGGYYSETAAAKYEEEQQDEEEDMEALQANAYRFSEMQREAPSPESAQTDVLNLRAATVSLPPSLGALRQSLRTPRRARVKALERSPIPSRRFRTSTTWIVAIISTRKARSAL